MSLAPLGHERGSEEKRRNSLDVFYDVHTRLADGFDHNAAFGSGDIALTGIEDVIFMAASACNPDHTVLTFDRHAVLPVVQA